MHTVRQWLEQLGLPQYAEVFAENDVDLEALRLLAESDLEKLGVSLGHRKKLLKAVSELDGGLPLARAAPPIQASPPTREREFIGAEGERRQLTVLFCDMVGFTELANRVDPEVLQQIIRTYEDTSAAAITRYEGYVFQRLGDGIVAFFGYPLAHEGEAERAIKAGLEIIEALARREVPDAGHLAVRIGIATGLVVVSGAEKGAVGETMSLAARHCPARQHPGERASAPLGRWQLRLPRPRRAGTQRVRPPDPRLSNSGRKRSSQSLRSRPPRGAHAISRS